MVTPASAPAFAAVDRSQLGELEYVIATRGVELPGAVVLDDLLEPTRCRSSSAIPTTWPC